MKHVFGPVPSRRLGNSLGVDLVPFKTCTFDCIYCQLGRTTYQTAERRQFVPASAVLAEVRAVVESGAAIDYITISGSGEPTLSLDLGTVIQGIKTFTAIPVAVLTNSSLLGQDAVCEDLAAADIVVPSFDAATQGVFERLNRPRGVDAQALAADLRAFTLGYAGQVWLEVMVVRGVNDTLDEMRAIVAALEGGRFDKVQLNTVVRAPAEADALPVEPPRLAELARVLEALAPVEIIGSYEGRHHCAASGDAAERILATLARRPCGADELAASLGMSAAAVGEQVNRLEREGRVERCVVGGVAQFRARAPQE